MSQVTNSLDDESEQAARAAAAAAKMPLSRWFAQFAEREKEKKRGDWQSFFAEVDKHKDLWAEFPTLEEIRATDVPDLPRESL